MSPPHSWPHPSRKIPPNAEPGESYAYSRGYLPHVEIRRPIQMITYRTADSLPATVVRKILAELESDEQQSRVRQRMEAYLDAGHGQCWLRRSDVAAIVRDAWHYFDGDRYKLHAWVIMPNHVHVLVEEHESFPMRTIIKSWKAYTARFINMRLRRKGIVWQREYWDRFIRSRQHFNAAFDYIVSNPVKARLVKTVEDWPWCSWNDRKTRD